MKKIETLQSGNFAENDWMEMLKSVGEFHPYGGFFRVEYEAWLRAWFASRSLAELEGLYGAFRR